MLVILIGEVDDLFQDLAKGLGSEFYKFMESWGKIQSSNLYQVTLGRWNALHAPLHVFL